MSVQVPHDLKSLFTSMDEHSLHFRTYIRAYNNSFAFTSFGVKSDKNFTKRNKGIYIFKAQGQVYHYINELLPEDHHPRYLQLYFYGTDHEVENRLFASSNLLPDVIKRLTDILRVNRM